MKTSLLSTPFNSINSSDDNLLPSSILSSVPFSQQRLCLIIDHAPLYTQGVSNRKYVDGVSRNSCPRLRFAKYFTCESCQWRLAAYRVYRNVSMTFVFGLVSRFPPTDEYRIDFDFTASFTGIILRYRIDESGGRAHCEFLSIRSI